MSIFYVNFYFIKHSQKNKVNKNEYAKHIRIVWRGVSCA